MDANTRARLEAAGYAVYDHVGDWLGMTAEEKQLLDLQLALTRALRARLTSTGLTRRQAAARLKLKVAELADLENFGGSLDQLFRALFGLGGTAADVFPPQPASRRPKPSRPRKRVPA